MRSMSSGFRSTMRFTTASWVRDGLEPPLARVMAFWFDGIAALLTITPSTT